MPYNPKLKINNSIITEKKQLSSLNEAGWCSVGGSLFNKLTVSIYPECSSLCLFSLWKSGIKFRKLKKNVNLKAG